MGLYQALVHTYDEYKMTWANGNKFDFTLYTFTSADVTVASY